MAIRTVSLLEMRNGPSHWKEYTQGRRWEVQSPLRVGRQATVMGRNSGVGFQTRTALTESRSLRTWLEFGEQCLWCPGSLDF